MANPMVTVWCSTYNHQAYIAQAIESFIAQRAQFPIEIFIHDDASTDGTPEIIRGYAVRYPQITPILRTTNMFSRDQTFLNKIMFERARGTYIAMCEGDDYWTEQDKLRKQVDFLQQSPQYAAVASSTRCYVEETGRFIDDNSHRLLPLERDVLVPDIIAGFQIYTNALMFRNAPLELELLDDLIIGDKPMQMLIARRGPIKFFNRAETVYRVHKSGMMHTFVPANVERLYSDQIRFLRRFDELTHNAYGNAIQSRVDLLETCRRIADARAPWPDRIAASIRHLWIERKLISVEQIKNVLRLLGVRRTLRPEKPGA